MTTQPVKPPLPWISDLALRLRTCLCDALVDNPPCWCGVWPGSEVPWDHCGECDGGSCGTAYVQVTNAFVSSEFPFPDTEGRCYAPMAYELTVGVVRCIPVADEEGNLPSSGEILSSFLTNLDDQQAVWKAIQCCMGKDVTHTLGSWEPLGPQGGCVGGQFTVTVTN